MKSITVFLVHELTVSLIPQRIRTGLEAFDEILLIGLVEASTSVSVDLPQ